MNLFPKKVEYPFNHSVCSVNQSLTVLVVHCDMLITFLFGCRIAYLGAL